MTTRQTVNRVALFDAMRLLDSGGASIAGQEHGPGSRHRRRDRPRAFAQQIGDSCEFGQEISPRKELSV
jgi:hypothetical protein